MIIPHDANELMTMSNYSWTLIFWTSDPHITRNFEEIRETQSLKLEKKKTYPQKTWPRSVEWHSYNSIHRRHSLILGRNLDSIQFEKLFYKIILIESDDNITYCVSCMVTHCWLVYQSIMDYFSIYF